jgi:glyoxylase I family protein
MLINIKGINHIAIICSNYKLAKEFYVDVLGLTVLSENFQKERDSYKIDLGINGVYQLELFIFKKCPKRLTYPEASGLRHLAFSVDNIEETINGLKRKGIEIEDIRNDQYTGKRFVFIKDPDDLPIELYELK